MAATMSGAPHATDALPSATSGTESADVRVLRRFQPRKLYSALPAPADTKLGLYLDCETTGLDTAADSIIELGIVPFRFDVDGHVFGVGSGFNFFEDPGAPLAPEITALTGITDDMVSGRRFPDSVVDELAQDAAIVIAHNADFDRKLTERRFPSFVRKAWACSYREVAWKSFGCACSKLSHLLIETCDEFYAGHRALDDCRVGLHILATAEHGGRTAFSQLLESARQPAYRVSVVGTPYSFNMRLKQRGYHWHDGSTGRAKEWHKEGPASLRDAEVEWLCAEGVRPLITRFNAFDRYSVRAA